MHHKKSTYSKTITLVSLTLLIFLLGLSPNLIQKYYSTRFYLYISSALRFISSLFPFSLGDLIYGILLIYVLYKIFRFCQKIKRKQLVKQDKITIPLKTLNFLLILYILFKIVWGLNYSRPSISEELGIGNKKYSVKELILLGNYFVNKTNYLKAKCMDDGNKINRDYDFKNLKQLAIESYAKAAKNNTVFQYKNASIKAVTSTWLTSKAGIEGYYTPLTGEANINTALPNFVKPYVICHEIGHQLGIAYEDEANLMGYLTASNSEDIYFQYSANYQMLRYILFEIRMKSPEDYKILKPKLAPLVLADFKAEKEFWRQYNGQMFGYMDAAFDKFLKLNNQPKGIDSYQDIVIWLWNLHKNEL